MLCYCCAVQGLTYSEATDRFYAVEEVYDDGEWQLWLASADVVCKWHSQVANTPVVRTQMQHC